MKPESVKILIGEVDYKLERIEFFKGRLEEWEDKENKEYDQSLRRLNKLIDETVNLIQIMKIEGLEEFTSYEDVLKKLSK